MIIILLILLILFILFQQNPEFTSRSSKYYDILSKFSYVDEHGKIINHFEEEINEQEDALEYINSSDVVLELGGRYGSVSVAIAHRQNNNGNLVVIEPDTSIISSLEANKKRNNANFTILNKYISNKNKQLIKAGYGSYLIDSNDPDSLSITYEDFKNKYPLPFNVLVADCEGCLCEFIDTLGEDINGYNKILFEADHKDKCNYNTLLRKLKTLGFEVVKNDSNFRYVLIKKIKVIKK